MLSKYDSYQSPPAYSLTRGHIPPGQYKAKIVDCKWSYGENHKIVVNFMILDEGKEFNKRCNMYLNVLTQNKFQQQAKDNLTSLLAAIGAPPLKTETNEQDLPVFSCESLKNVLFKETTVYVDLISSNGRTFNVAGVTPPHNMSPADNMQATVPAAVKAKPWEDDDVPF